MTNPVTDDVTDDNAGRVPYTLYFHKSEGLHGTYWHDRFGTCESHGCVNLSLADARWLFD
jgi:lipoprotein-anchoring transpeptidase ErfK/SrfK